jgi:hypothetical protein
MPRGVPSKGFRLTERRKKMIAAHGGDVSVALRQSELQNLTERQAAGDEFAMNWFKNTASRIMNIKEEEAVEESTETDEEIEKSQTETFDTLADLTGATIAGYCPAQIVSGAPGLGKTYTVEMKLNEYDPDGQMWTVVKGRMTAAALFTYLFLHKEEGQILVFDDCDSIFYDEASLNLLKAVCDTTEKRVVTWGTKTGIGTVQDKNGLDVSVDRTFEFNGSIIFITNLDFDGMIASKNRLAPHLGALMSRSHYIDIGMRSKRDFLVRIRSMILKHGLLDKNAKTAGLTKEQQKEVLDFIVENKDTLRELSLRQAIKVGINRKAGFKDWKAVSKRTCCRIK